MNNFDYEGARKAGYSDAEIKAHVMKMKPKEPAKVEPKYQKSNPEESAFSKIGKNFSNFFGNFGDIFKSKQDEQVQEDKNQPLQHPNFDVEGALQAGYSENEIKNHLRKLEERNKPKKEERSFGAKSGRVAGQFGLGLAENALLPYELSVLPLASESGANSRYRETLMDDLERLQDQKQMGQWDEQDQRQLESIQNQLQNPEESQKFANPTDISVRGLAEKATGLDLHPEGTLEKAAGWTGFLKDPKKGIQLVKDIAKFGVKPKALFNAIRPGTHELRGLAAGSALQMAEEGKLGPIGTIAAAITADVAAHGPKGLFYVASNPKKAGAETLNFFTQKNSKKNWAKQVSEDFKKSGLQIDAGTLSDSPLIQMMQARAAQSGLFGSALDTFKETFSGQVVREYENILSELGEMTFENSHQAGEAIKNALKVNEINLNSVPDISRKGRSLQGRVNVQERPNYQNDLLNRISPQEFENTYQAGETLKTASEDIKAPIKQEFNERWSNFNNEVRNIESGPQGELAREMRDFVQQNEGSLLLGESTPEHRVLRAAQELQNRLMTPEGGLIGVSVNDLIKTKRTLSDVANWEFGGSNFESSYKKLVADIDSAINRTLAQTNPELLNTFRELNAEYSNYKELFENKNVLKLFEPRNLDYNSIYNSFISNPDKLRSLEDIFYNNPRGQDLINQVKRDYAERIIQRPNITPREIRDLSHVLGPEYAQDIERFIAERQHALEHPLPQVQRQNRLPIRPTNPNANEINPLVSGRVKETGVKRSEDFLRNKAFESIKNKSPEQIMNQMNTVEGIRKLKKVLNLTSEGKELFNQLSRFKIDEMITKKMKDSATQNLKLGTFSNLLKTSKDKSILHELLGNESFKRLELLQRNSGTLQKSADKFFNASKSGSVLIDASLAGTAISGVLTGNIFLALPAIAKVGGMHVISSLLTDPEFIKYFEQAILTNNKEKFLNVLKKIEPNVKKAIHESNKQLFMDENKDTST